MSVTRFIAFKFKDAFNGADEKAKQAREGLYQKHLELYRSRPYVLDVEGILGNQDSSADHGYHYAFVVKFESTEKVKYYNDEDPDHIEFKNLGKPLLENIFIWAFAPRS